MLLDWMAANELVVVNQVTDRTTHRVGQESRIDLTLAKTKIDGTVIDWLIIA